MAEKKLITFYDSICRTIIGEFVSDTEHSIVVANPVIVNIVPQMFPVGHPQAGQPSGQMALQLLPAFFKEFQADKSGKALHTYPKNQIVQIEIEGGFEFRLEAQYSQIFNPPPQAPQAPAPQGMQPPPTIPGQHAAQPQAPQPAAAAAPTLKLFDDVEEESSDG